MIQGSNWPAAPHAFKAPMITRFTTQSSDIELLFDDTVWGGAKDDFCVVNGKLYFHEMFATEKVSGWTCPALL